MQSLQMKRPSQQVQACLYEISAEKNYEKVKQTKSVSLNHEDM